MKLHPMFTDLSFIIFRVAVRSKYHSRIIECTCLGFHPKVFLTSPKLGSFDCAFNNYILGGFLYAERGEPFK